MKISGSLLCALVADIVVTRSARDNLGGVLVTDVALDVTVVLAVRIFDQLESALGAEECSVPEP